MTIHKATTRALLLGGAAALLLPTAALADDAPKPVKAETTPGMADDVDHSRDTNTIRNADDVIVTASRVNAETPITASIHTYEPQAIVSRSIIENSVPPTADISDVILLTPSASGTSNGNGPGLSESKTVLRGFQDGFFNITYDGVPFGDSNNPTHHSTAYFPTGTYERIIVDRGPGSATDLGQASFGGNIHLVSRELSDKAGADLQGVYGSYDTYLGRVTLQSGSIDQLAGLRVIAVGEYKRSDGALTGSSAWFVNGFAKAELPLGDRAKFSILSSYNQDYYHQSDNNGVSCNRIINGGAVVGRTDATDCTATSQVGLYGKTFGLVDFRDPKFAGTPYADARNDWNWTNKTTDFEIARLQVDLTDHISFDNKAYTYFYKNFTISTETSTALCTGVITQTTCGGQSTLLPGAPPTKPCATIQGNIPGYTKVNQYRTWGDIAQVNVRTSFGTAKVGIWYESSSSHRYRYDYDFTRAFAAGAFGDYHFDFAATSNFYNYKEKYTAGVTNQITGAPVPLYIRYDERTGWEQVQGFGEFEFKFFDDRLTFTPGVKVQSFTRTINTPIASQTARVGIVAQDSYKPTLPYVAGNFLLFPNWSFYAQYAKGFLIPQLSDSLEAIVPNPNARGGVSCLTSGGAAVSNCNLQPTKTTNYQVGTVYAGERLNVDADLYYITATNSTSVDPSTNIATATGVPAIYKGAEAQVSYVIIPHLTGIVNGSINSAKNDDAAHLTLQQAPDYTALAGVVYTTHNVKLSYLHKFTGRQYADNANQVRIAPYSSGIAAATVYYGPVGIGVTVYNVFDDRSTTKIGSATGTQPLYFFQPGRSYEAQLRFRF